MAEEAGRTGCFDLAPFAGRKEHAIATKKLEELNLIDDFLFYSMMAYPEIGEAFAQKILELVFQKKFGKLKIVAQKAYGGKNTDLRGARLDVYVEDEERAKIDSSENPYVYDLEPDQNGKQKSIMAFSKRARFYHAIIDSRSLKSGEDFGKLRNVYVIFICNYDPFGFNRIRYTIKNVCVEDPQMPYEDGIRTIVLYTRGTKGEVSLEYMKGFERDMLMYEEGREEERKNTERERRRADNALKLVQTAEKKIQQLQTELEQIKKQQASRE